MTQENIRDFTFRVANANKTEMIVILYDIARTYISDAMEALDKFDNREFRRNVNLTRDTVRELMDSVHTETEAGLSLLKLYIFMNGELTRAFMDFAKEPLYHVLSLIVRLEDVYHKFSEEDTSGPVMEHTERVVQGFTYNKNMQQECVTSPEAGRGFLA